MTTRRKFINQSAWGIAGLYGASLSACNTSGTQPTKEAKTMSQLNSNKELKISLAQWSMNRALFAKEIDPSDFASIAANQYGIYAVEYVNQFYVENANNENFWIGLKKRADNEKVKSLLIMVDDEGDLGNTNDAQRSKAVENHYKWVNAAKLLDCHSIRVNAFGDGSKTAVRAALIDGMSRLCDYAKQENINVLIENHGLFSSDGAWVADLIKEADRDNFGTLPDFGNWCLNEKWGSTQNNKCSEVYDRYQGVSDFLPYAKGVSAKSYDFDVNGHETIIDYKKMLDIVKNSDFDGYIGVEYEGERLTEPEGIIATKNLLEKTWQAYKTCYHTQKKKRLSF